MPITERMSELGPKLRGVVSWSRGQLRERWNMAYYGFAEGKAPLERTHQLLGKDHLDKGELGELLDLTTMKGVDGSSLQVDMAEKVEHTVVELFPKRRPDPFNPSDPAA